MRQTGMLTLSLLTAAALCGQEPNPTQKPAATESGIEAPAPLYEVNVVAHTTSAVNYGHRAQPTKIDFVGTVLHPDAKGEARIDAERGVVEVRAKFKDLAPPQRFGLEYLTYVLWAVTPDGRATNLGEIITDSGNNAKLETATELQSFALIVTAEPYYAVTHPSDVVVLENAVRPDTSGRIETVDAKYELLKRGQYAFDIKAAKRHDKKDARKVSQREYEALVELYQARNALQLAAAGGAREYAPETYKKAEVKLEAAERRYSAEPKSRQVVSLAREATQTAEDARLIASRRKASEQATTVERPSEPFGGDPAAVSAVLGSQQR